MMNDALDLAFLLQMSDCDARKTAVHFQSLDDDALADELEGGDFLQNAVVCGLV
jgi:hypothetical protein